MKGSFDNTKIRDIIQKTKDAGICIIGNYMFGFWDDDVDTMQETLDLAQELNTEYVNFYCVTAFPQTPLYNQLQAKRVSLPTDFNQYAQTYYGFKALPTKYITAKRVLEFRDGAFRAYFTNSQYLQSIKSKFGFKVVDEINKMMSIPLRRMI
jgi:radical SAM superfamily enzyme